MIHDYTCDVVAAIDEVVAYAKDKALYDVQCRVNAVLGDWRKAKLAGNAGIMHGLTCELSMVKLKLDLLEARIAGYPAELKEALAPLLDTGKARIEELRRFRQQSRSR